MAFLIRFLFHNKYQMMFVFLTTFFVIYKKTYRFAAGRQDTGSWASHFACFVYFARFFVLYKNAKKKIFVFFGGEWQASSSAAAIIQL